MIKCAALRKNNQGQETRDWEITTDGRVFPCCYFVNCYTMHSQSDHQAGDVELWRNDKVLMEKFEKDPDWNKVPENNFDDIINDDFWWDYVYTKGWNSAEPPIICKKECWHFHKDLKNVDRSND